MKLLKTFHTNITTDILNLLADKYFEQTDLGVNMDVSDALMEPTESLCRHLKYGEE